MKEQWKDVVGFERCYQVSSLGRIRSKDRISIRKNGSKITNKGTMINLHSDNNGYLRYRFRNLGSDRTLKIHRVVAQAFIENFNNELQVNHVNGNKKDNRLVNLEMLSGQENIDHARFMCLIKKRVPLEDYILKMDECHVLAIYSMPKPRKNKKDKFTSLYIGNEFGVSSSNIRTIRNGKHFKNMYRLIHE